MYQEPDFSRPRDAPGSPTGYPDHGDEPGEYFDLGRIKERRRRRRSRKHSSRSRSSSGSDSASSRSQTRTLSRTTERSRSQSKTDVESSKELKYRQPSLLDAFRIIYLTTSKPQHNSSKYLETRKKQDHVKECLKKDGLGSKKLLFYPRSQRNLTDSDIESKGTFVRENSDQRIKINGDFFRKFKKNKKVDTDSPIAKLKRWELNLYKKFGFIRAV